MRDVVDVLREDHARLRWLLRQLDLARDPDRRADLVERLTQEMHQHTWAEEDHFYPAYRTAVASEEAHVRFHESIDEHRLIDEVLDDFDGLDPASSEHIAKGRLLKELVERHTAAEERVLFRQARRALPRHDLRQLGEQVLQERSRALVMP